MRQVRTVFFFIALSTLALLVTSLDRGGTVAATPQIPQVWDETALADWATPVAGLNVRPTNMSASDYYSMAVENLRRSASST
jgi:hypothetical protein